MKCKYSVGQCFCELRFVSDRVTAKTVI